MRESVIEYFFTDSLKELGGEIRKLQWVNHRGAPDRLLLYKGIIVFVEFKATGEKLQPHQAREKKKLEAQGATVLVIDSLEKSADILDRLENFKCLD